MEDLARHFDARGTLAGVELYEPRFPFPVVGGKELQRGLCCFRIAFFVMRGRRSCKLGAERAGTSRASALRSDELERLSLGGLPTGASSLRMV